MAGFTGHYESIQIPVVCNVGYGVGAKVDANGISKCQCTGEWELPICDRKYCILA